MVDLMLDDLRDISAEVLRMLREFLIQISYRDFLIPRCFPDSRKRKAAFFGFIRPGFFGDDRIDHDDISQSGGNDDDRAIPDRRGQTQRFTQTYRRSSPQ